MEGISRDPRRLLALTLAQLCRLEGQCIISRTCAMIYKRQTMDWLGAPEQISGSARSVETKSITARQRLRSKGFAFKPSLIMYRRTRPYGENARRACCGHVASDMEFSPIPTLNFTKKKKKWCPWAAGRSARRCPAPAGSSAPRDPAARTRRPSRGTFFSNQQYIS